jgi:hypothetical protein
MTDQGRARDQTANAARNRRQKDMTTNAQARTIPGRENASLQNLIVSDKAVRLLANSIFRQLQDEGCRPKDIISVSSQLIDLVTSELQKEADPSNL